MWGFVNYMRLRHLIHDLTCFGNVNRWGKTGISSLAFSNPSLERLSILHNATVAYFFIYIFYQGLSSLTPGWLAGVGSALTLERTSSYCWEQNIGRFQKCAQQPVSCFILKTVGSPEKIPAESLWAQLVNIVLSVSFKRFVFFWLRVSAGKEAPSSQLFQMAYKLKDAVAEVRQAVLG